MPCLRKPGSSELRVCRPEAREGSENAYRGGNQFRGEDGPVSHNVLDSLIASGVPQDYAAPSSHGSERSNARHGASSSPKKLRSQAVRPIFSLSTGTRRLHRVRTSEAGSHPAPDAAADRAGFPKASEIQTGRARYPAFVHTVSIFRSCSHHGWRWPDKSLCPTIASPGERSSRPHRLCVKTPPRTIPGRRPYTNAPGPPGEIVPGYLLHCGTDRPG